MKRPLTNHEKHRSSKATINIYSMSRRECIDFLLIARAYTRKIQFASEKEETRTNGWLVRNGFSRKEKGEGNGE